MSSFWTPGGEHPVEPAGGAAPSPDSGTDDLSPEGRAQLEAEAAAMAAELAATPAAVVVANHVVGLFQLAAIHLNADPPHLEDGRLAIDAVKAVLDAAGDRLGDDGDALRTGLGQLQMAYVQLHRRADASDEPAPGDGGEPQAD